MQRRTPRYCPMLAWVSEYRNTDHKIQHLRSSPGVDPVSYTHLRAHETDSYLVCRLLLEKKKYAVFCLKKKNSFFFFFFLMIRRQPRSTHCISSAASDVYKRQIICEQGLTPQFVQASRHPGTDFDVVSMRPRQLYVPFFLCRVCSVGLALKAGDVSDRSTHWSLL